MESDKQHSRSSLSLPLSLSLAVTWLKLKSKEKGKEKRNLWAEEARKSQKKGEEHKPGERKQQRPAVNGPQEGI